MLTSLISKITGCRNWDRERVANLVSRALEVGVDGISSDLNSIDQVRLARVADKWVDSTVFGKFQSSGLAMDGRVWHSSAQSRLTDYGLPARCDLRLTPDDRSVGFQLGGIFPPRLFRDALQVSEMDHLSAEFQKFKLPCSV